MRLSWLKLWNSKSTGFVQADEMMMLGLKRRLNGRKRAVMLIIINFACLVGIIIEK